MTHTHHMSHTTDRKMDFTDKVPAKQEEVIAL